jgi:hypothetical protein
MEITKEEWEQLKQMVTDKLIIARYHGGTLKACYDLGDIQNKMNEIENKTGSKWKGNRT